MTLLLLLRPRPTWTVPADPVLTPYNRRSHITTPRPPTARPWAARGRVKLLDTLFVKNDAGQPLIALLTDVNGVVDLTVPSSIQVRIRDVATGAVVTGTCTVVNWPTLYNGATVKAAQYAWGSGGNTTPGDKETEWILTYGTATVTLPAEGPYRFHIRDVLS